MSEKFKINIHDISFDGEFLKSNTSADKDCVMCGGSGYYMALNVGEYDENMMSVRCCCTNKKPRH